MHDEQNRNSYRQRNVGTHSMTAVRVGKKKPTFKYTIGNTNTTNSSSWWRKGRVLRGRRRTPPLPPSRLRGHTRSARRPPIVSVVWYGSARCTTIIQHPPRPRHTEIPWGSLLLMIVCPPATVPRCRYRDRRPSLSRVHVAVVAAPVLRLREKLSIWE